MIFSCNVSVRCAVIDYTRQARDTSDDANILNCAKHVLYTLLKLTYYDT